MANEPYAEVVIKAAEKIIAGGSGTAANPSVVVGNVASDAVDSGAPLKIGGKANNNGPVQVAVGDRVDALFNLDGSLAITAFDGAVNAGGDGRTVLYGISGRTGYLTTPNPVAIGPYILNGTSWDRQRKPNVSKRIASSAASGNPDFLKASAGDLVQFWGLCGAVATYLQVYNKATAPTVGTDTPILTFPITANERFNVQIPGGGFYFATGIAYAFTTDAAGTTGSLAAAVTACNILGA